MCLPSPVAFQIHFQVNTVWPATNLQPTGVVTAVADNGKSKLHPGSGMFTVTTGKLAANIFFQHFLKEDPPLVINFILTNRMLNLLPCAILYRCTKLKSLQWILKSQEKDTDEKKILTLKVKLKVTHSCQQLLGVWRNVRRDPPFSHRVESSLFPSPCPAPKQSFQAPYNVP